MNLKIFSLKPFSGALILFVVAHFCHHLLPSLLVPLLPFIRSDLTLDYTQSGLLVSAFTLSYGLGQLPAGWLTDRIGARQMITVAISGVAFCGLLTGLSTTYLRLIVCLVMMGLIGGGYHPSAPPLISASVASQTRGLALGLHIIGGSACFFLTPLIAAATATALGWRGSFIGIALPTMAFGLVLYRLLPSISSAEEIKAPSKSGDDTKSSGFTNLRPLLAFIILSVSTFAVIHSSVAFIPLYMVDHFGIEEEKAAAFLAILYSAGFWAAPLGGYLSDRLGSIPLILGLGFISGPVIFLFNFAQNVWAFGGLLLVFGMIHVMRYPISESYIIDQTPARHLSTILGIYFFSCTESGGILAPLMGYLIDRSGFFICFTSAGIFLTTITLVCSFFLRKRAEI
jgi:MFS family permease